ncbi:hypothetical protein [Enterococcus gallinarum]|uniref:hypothetical protein n=1 Tax=Enterococcus TaxID=1350 RepID=UPI003F75BFAF
MPLKVGYVDAIKDLREIEESDQPQLNDNQRIVLEYLKEMCPPKLGVSAMVTAYCLVDDNINDNWQEYSEEIPEHIEALQELSIGEENQVLEVFAKWALEQEEE